MIHAKSLSGAGTEQLNKEVKNWNFSASEDGFIRSFEQFNHIRIIAQNVRFDKHKASHAACSKT